MATKSAVSSRKTASPTPTMFQKSTDEPEEGREVQPTAQEQATPKEKRTFHLDSDVVILLGKIQFDQWQATGRKPNLSDLVGEGIRLLAESRNEAETQTAD